ncbi:MAG TPA: hypothetical protein ENN41_10420 [Sediminispirochaeta sp.]|nr:hypothetical protein [Sediminispirochaeta sp.]
MQRYKFLAASLIFLLIVGVTPSLFSQSEEENEGDRQQEQPIEAEPPLTTPEDESFLEPYSLGSQTFSINAGFFIPLFFQYPGLEGGDELNSIEPGWEHLSLGGTGSLSWGSYLTPRFALGAKLSGTFSFTPNGELHSLIPITMWAEYLFRSGSFEFPVSLQGGVVINRAYEEVYFGPIAIPGISGYYNINAEWGLGLSLEYYWVPEIYFGDKSNATSFGNMLELSFSARYHFS